MAWYDIYRAYDDDALTTLSSAGLLRRALKDLETGKVQWHEQGADFGVVSADGQLVQLNLKGPQQARCSCPSPTICKHILGAVIWLRTLDSSLIGTAGVDSAGAVSAGAVSTENHSADVFSDLRAPADSQVADASVVNADGAMPIKVDPLAEILTLDQTIVFKQAGVAAVRRAASTPLTQFEWSVKGASVLMLLPELGQHCRWVAGAGFEGMISEVPAKERKAIHLLALAALRAEHRQPFEWPGELVPVATQQSNRGLSHTEQLFVLQVIEVVAELVANGLSHVSQQSAGRLLALNMSARAENLPRIASLLRNLSGTIDLLVKRDHRAQEIDAFLMVSRIYALCNALLNYAVPNPAIADTSLPWRSNENDPERLQELRGRVQRNYRLNEAIDLLPLGAYWWETRGGARGLTIAFWNFTDYELVQATLARPDGSDTQFNQYSAWHSQLIWSGAGSAEKLCRQTLRLEQPRLAEGHRLAIAGVTTASTMNPWSVTDPRLSTVGIFDWRNLQNMISDSVGLVGEVVDLVLLRPVAHAMPVLDEVAQQLNWAIKDQHDCWLTVSLSVSAEKQNRAENLERLLNQKINPIAVLVKVVRFGYQVTLEPIAILMANGEQNLIAVSLDFAEKTNASDRFTDRLLRMFKTREQRGPQASQSRFAEQLLSPLLDLLENQSATGRLNPSHSQRQHFEQVAGQLRSAGMDSIANAVQNHLEKPNPQSLMQLCWLSSMCLELGNPFNSVTQS